MVCTRRQCTPLSGGQKRLVNAAEATLSRAFSPIMSEQVTSVQTMYTKSRHATDLEPSVHFQPPLKHLKTCP